MDEAVKLIQNVGFPIFVALWLLYVGGQQNQSNINTLVEMRSQIEKLVTAIQVLTALVSVKGATIEIRHDPPH